MFPSITLFGRTITTYLLLALIGAFAAGFLVCYLAKKRKEDENDAIIVLLFAALGSIIGSHILYGITNIRFIPAVFSATSFSQFLERFRAVFGGSVFYGGLIGGIFAAYITVRIKRLNVPAYSDMISTSIPLFHSFARIGCFLGGCCYGIECSFGFTAHGNEFVPAVNDVSRFPVPLLEAALNLILFFIIYNIYKRSLSNTALQGKILFIYLAAYSVIRFFDEFLRGDEIRGFIFGLSTSQFISLILFVVSVTVLIALRIKKQKA